MLGSAFKVFIFLLMGIDLFRDGERAAGQKGKYQGKTVIKKEFCQHLQEQGGGGVMPPSPRVLEFLNLL